MADFPTPLPDYPIPIERQTFQVAYINEDADDHSIGAQDLAAALLGFGELIEAANRELNKNQATVRLVVTSEFEHKCFNINFELIQVILEHIDDLLTARDSIVDANAILNTIGIVTAAAITTTGTIVGSVLGYLQWKAGRRVESATTPIGSELTTIKLEGDNATINVTNNVYRLANNPEVLAAIEETVAPIAQGKNVKAIQFRQNDIPVSSLNKDDVSAVVASCEQRFDKADEEEASSTGSTRIVIGTLRVYAPVYEAKAPLWRFKYRNKPIYADIRETSIAKDALLRGGALADDRYRVKMEVTEPTEEGKDKHYKIIEVLDFTPAAQQIGLPFGQGRRKPKRASRAR